MKKTIAIQGVAGAYHEVAAKEYFGEETAILECKSFKEVFNSVMEGKTDFGVVAIENTIAGTLRQNYILLQDSELEIIGEYKLRIEHALCVLPDDSIENIKEVHSHPIALMQCEAFLEQYPTWNVVEKDDTASSAKRIAEQHLTGCAAICGEYAAQLYGLKILFKGIETNKRNFTRFLILRKPQRFGIVEGADKASIAFTLAHQSGSLSQVLSIFSFYGINLTKIESLPIIGKEFEYHFLIDLSFDNFDRYRQSLSAIEPLTSELSVIGEYKEAPLPSKDGFETTN